MDTFPAHALSRSYSLGTPRWRLIDAGSASMTLGSGVLRTREELGQAIYAVDLRIEGLTESEAGVIWTFAAGHRGETFWWSDPKIGPFSAVKYATFECVFSPDQPPQIAPRPGTHDRYDAEIILLPILPTVAVPALVAHWKLNDNAADTVVADASGNSHTGTASVDTDELTASGKIGTAFAFASEDEADVEVAHHADLGLTNGGCVAFWVKQTARGETTLIGKKYGWSVYIHDTTHAVTSYSHALSGTLVTVGPVVPLDTWVHVAAQFSDSSRKIYVNGVDATVSEATPVNPTANTDKVAFGNWRVAPPYKYCDALLDDIRIYNRPLTALEIAAIYNNGTGTEATTVP